MTQFIARMQSSRWISALTWFSAGAPAPRLDIGGLSDHLKRDMGFLDGNDPLGKRR